MHLMSESPSIPLPKQHIKFNRIVTQRGSEQVPILKKKLSSKEHIQLTLSHQDRFHTIQNQYAQTLNAFQEDLQKLLGLI